MCLSGLFYSKGFAQNTPIYSQFFMNPYFYNPAYAGGERFGSIFLSHRKQWLGIAEAPEASIFSWHGPVSDRVALGANVYTETYGILQNSNAQFTFAYNVPISSNQYIRFGLSGGLGMFSVDLDAVNGINDPALLNALGTNYYIDGQFGAKYHINGFNIGVTLPNLFERSLDLQAAFGEFEINPLNSYLFMANYRFYNQKGDFAFEPHFLYRLNNAGPDQYEALGLLHFQNLVWIGGGYKSNAGIKGLAGLDLNKKMSLGYAYELPVGAVKGFSTGSHEIVLGIHYGAFQDLKNKRNRSFISRHRLSPAEERKARQEALAQRRLEQRKQEEERKRREEQAKLQADREAQEAEERREREREEEAARMREAERQARLNAAAEQERRQKEEEERLARQQRETEQERQRRLEEENRRKIEEENKLAAQRERQRRLEEARKAEAELERQRERDNDQANSRREREEQERLRREREEQERLKREREEQERLRKEREEAERQAELRRQREAEERARREAEERARREAEEAAKAAPKEPENRDAVMVVKKGGHLLELQEGYYVVVGVYESFREAEEFSDNLFTKGFYAKFGYVSGRKNYYVYLLQTGSERQATAERDRLRKNKIFESSWILHIE